MSFQGMAATARPGKQRLGSLTKEWAGQRGDVSAQCRADAGRLSRCSWDLHRFPPPPHFRCHATRATRKLTTGLVQLGHRHWRLINTKEGRGVGHCDLWCMMCDVPKNPWSYSTSRGKRSDQSQLTRDAGLGSARALRCSVCADGCRRARRDRSTCLKTSQSHPVSPWSSYCWVRWLVRHSGGTIDVSELGSWREQREFEENGSSAEIKKFMSGNTGNTLLCMSMMGWGCGKAVATTCSAAGCGCGILTRQVVLRHRLRNTPNGRRLDGWVSESFCLCYGVLCSGSWIPNSIRDGPWASTIPCVCHSLPRYLRVKAQFTP